MMKTTWTVVLLVVLGLVAAASAAVLTATLRTSPRAAASVAEKPVTVLVATRDLPALAVVDTDAVSATDMTRSQAPHGFYSQPAQIIGKVTAVPVKKGQAFRTALFTGEGSGQFLAGMLPPGMRAVSVSLSDYSGLEGLLYPGSVVDVVAAFDVGPMGGTGGQAVSTTLLENIQVLAVEDLTVGTATEGDDAKAKDGRGVRPKETRRGIQVTLMVDPKEAESLQLAMEHGRISLALRNPSDQVGQEREPTMLSEGRLGNVADFIKPPVEVVQEAPEPAAPEPAAKPQFTVDIIRGTSAETRSFPMP